MTDPKRPTNTLPATGEIIDNSTLRPFGTEAGITSWRSKRQLSNAKAEELSAKLEARLQAVQHALGRQLEVTKKQIDEDTKIHVNQIIAQSNTIKSKLDEENIVALQSALTNLSSAFEEGIKKMEESGFSEQVTARNIETFTKMYLKKHAELEELYDL